MSGMQASQEVRGTETNSAGCGQREESPATVKSGEKARGVAEATVCAKPTSPTDKDCVQRSAAGRAKSRAAGSRKPPRTSSEDGVGNGQEDVRSVAELAVDICEAPESRKKRLKVAEALRERGLNESKLAAMYSGVAEKLSRNKEAGAVGVAAAKLLFDVLKELADWLEPQKTAGDSDASEAPQFVRLIHNVPRPVRTE
jgi:hypothetical protein